MLLRSTLRLFITLDLLLSQDKLPLGILVIISMIVVVSLLNLCNLLALLLLHLISDQVMLRKITLVWSLIMLILNDN